MMTKKQQKDKYELILMVMNLEEVELEKKLKALREVKQSLRSDYKQWLKEQEEEPEWHYSEDGESRWCKGFCDEQFTDEEKREFVKDHWKHINSPYDCTGKWFTQSITICNLPNGTSVIYFIEGLDV